MVPPVALLAYAPDAAPSLRVLALRRVLPGVAGARLGGRAPVPARFCDLPAAVMLARAPPSRAGAAGPRRRAGPLRGDPSRCWRPRPAIDDPERWWDHVIESRLDGRSPFAALTDAIAELRADAPAGRPVSSGTSSAARRTCARSCAPRCGTPPGRSRSCAAPGTPRPGREAAARPRRTPRCCAGCRSGRSTLTWVPWTHSRLAAASGYGAGITSPGWYHHLFTTPEQTVIRWLTKVARVLRDHDLPVSSAHVIEATRLAEALAALRARPLAGLAEVSEADQVGDVRRGRVRGRVRHPGPRRRGAARRGSRLRARPFPSRPTCAPRPGRSA